jgi:hypothetical protein
VSKLTKEFVESKIQTPITGHSFYRDDDVHGFVLRVTPKSKSYTLERSADGATKLITIGKCSGMSLDSARNQACLMLGDLAKGTLVLCGNHLCVTMFNENSVLF